jgi:hypothetical protein
MVKTEKGFVKKFFDENKDKFTKRRQASKYLMHFGSVYKTEQNIPMEYSTRTMVEIVPCPVRSTKNIKNKKK